MVVQLSHVKANMLKITSLRSEVLGWEELEILSSKE
jgi:hypothetical protein